jgi:ribonucleoside-diphosphate reductase alpha chain
MLPPYGSCCLGSINISNFCKDDKFDRKGFEHSIEIAVRFLDNIVTINDYPLEKIKANSTSDRRIGLGLMGLHYAMLKMGIKYSSEAGIAFTEKIYEILRNHSYWTSTELAKEKGAFEKFVPEKYLKSAFVKTLPTKIREKIRLDGIRNTCLNTQAPTGTTSIIASVSSGIEPIFAPVYERRFYSGDNIQTEIVADSLFEQYKEEGRDTSHFEGAHDVSPEWHILIQEAAQCYLDSSISKTINLPEDYPIEKMSELVLKYITKMKGITLYREGSRGESPLKPVSKKEYKNRQKDAEDVAKEVKCPSGSCSI